jgi:hypothetical protein
MAAPSICNSLIQARPDKERLLQMYIYAEPGLLPFELFALCGKRARARAKPFVPLLRTRLICCFIQFFTLIPALYFYFIVSSCALTAASSDKSALYKRTIANFKLPKQTNRSILHFTKIIRIGEQ